MALSTVVQKVLDWVHTGYPQGVPQQDYFPLLALLARHLTDAQVAEVVETLQTGRDRGAATRQDDVRAAIEAVTNAPTGDADVRRVEARLRDAGWELART
jgi:hypothetical protein